MSSNVMTLYYGDTIVGYVPHSGTSDITTSHIYDTYEECVQKLRSSEWLYCSCKEYLGQRVDCKGPYGSWSIWICIPCKAVIYCPCSSDAVLGALSYGGTDEQYEECKALIKKYKELFDAEKPI